MKILVSLVAVVAVARATPRNYLPPEVDGSNGYLGEKSQGELAPYEDNVPSEEYLSNRRDEDLSKKVYLPPRPQNAYLPPGPQNAYLPGVKNSVLPDLASDPVEKIYLPAARPQNTYLPPGSSEVKPGRTYLPPTRPQSTYSHPGRSQVNHLSHTSSENKPENRYLPSGEPQTSYLPPGSGSAEPKNTYFTSATSQNTYLTAGSADTDPKTTYLPSARPRNTYLPPDVSSTKFENAYLSPHELQNTYSPARSSDLSSGNTYLPPKSMKDTYLTPTSPWKTLRGSNPSPRQEYQSNQENFTMQSSKTSSSWTSSSLNSNIISAWSKAKWMVNGDSTREHSGTNQYDVQSQRHSVGYGYPHPDEIVNSKYDYQYRVTDSTSGNDFEHMENRDGDTVRGIYRVLLPDGRKQTVEYTADENGYRPVINYQNTDNGYPRNYKETHQGPY